MGVFVPQRYIPSWEFSEFIREICTVTCETTGTIVSTFPHLKDQYNGNIFNMENASLSGEACHFLTWQDSTQEAKLYFFGVSDLLPLFLCTVNCC